MPFIWEYDFLDVEDQKLPNRLHERELNSFAKTRLNILKST